MGWGGVGWGGVGWGEVCRVLCVGHGMVDHLSRVAHSGPTSPIRLLLRVL